jgi:hypothetical protein
MGALFQDGLADGTVGRNIRLRLRLKKQKYKVRGPEQFRAESREQRAELIRAKKTPYRRVKSEVYVL